MTQKVSHAVAHQDIRQYLNGMLFEFVQDNLRLVTTDSHRMGIIATKLNSAVSEEIKRFIVAKRSVAELARLLSLYEGNEVDIKISQHTLIASMYGWRFSSKLMNVNYPNYEQVIPAISSNYFSCNNAELKQALRKTAIVGEQNSTIQLTLKDDKLVCESRNLDNGETACTKISVESNVDTIDLSFNSKYLSDIIATATETDRLVFYISQEQQGVLICIDENKDVKYVIMPIKI